MATYQALGTGPVSFVDANFNQQELPLGQIFYSPNGWDVTTAPLYTTANQPLIDALIKQLVAQGFVAPAATSLAQQSSAPQMTIKAAQAGAPGNSITVTFSAASLSQGTFTVTASATETFANLTPAKPTPTGSATTIDMVMGTSQATATGLVYVTEGTGLMPKAYTGGVGVVEDVNGGTAFTLVATNTTDAADAALIQVTVTPGTTTFTVVVTWATQNPVTAQTFTTLLANGAPLSYLVAFSGPSGPLPSGTVTLTGGANASGANAAVPASASIYASS